MGEIIRDWLRTRLGVIIDLSPEIFGHYAKDGTLLAKVLHSYDVINDSQLSTLLETQDPALARVNLKHLRVWLKFVGIDCDTDCIEDISNGKGTMALRLFYKVYLCLENKDRLHFITLQKEREKYIPSSSKFDVTTVSEEQLIWQSREQLLADSLKKSTSLMNWERKKYEDLVGSSSRRFDKFRSSQKVHEILESLPIDSENKISSRKSLSRLESSRELDSFAKKHRAKKTPIFSDPCDNFVETGSGRPGKAIRIDEEAAKAYTKALRSKHRQEALARSFRTRMQMNLVAELWKKVLDDQEQEFDEIIAKKVLHQSQYEKQLVRKLCDVRAEKSRMAANRTIVEKLLEDTRESELRLEQERAREVMVREKEEVEAELRRIQELERRIEDQKRIKRELKVRKFGEKIVLDLVDIAIKSGEYRRESNDSKVPDFLSNQWKALFLKSQPILEADNVFLGKDELRDEKEQAENLAENEARTRVLNDEDFLNYHNIKSPWIEFYPKVDQEVADYLDLGILVLGYIVHKTLGNLHPEYATELAESFFPAMRTRAVVLGVPDSLLYEPIQQLLKKSKIHLVRLEEAINYCLGEYKAEMRDFEFIDLEVIGATREIAAGASRPSEVEESGKKKRRKGEKNSGRKSKTSLDMEKLEISKNAADKVTQTPRLIPHEDKDPVLGNTAYIGKWIHEFLSLGEPLTEDLIARAIVEYLKGLENVDEGFVLVNYPNNYREMSSLEFALSGKKLPDHRDSSSGKRESSKLEEIDSILSRISFDESEYDSEMFSSGSRLVPNPMTPQFSSGTSCLTAFVRIKPKESKNEEDDDIWEILSETANSVDEFYVDQEIASILYYTIFDLATLKKLVRLLVAEKNELISRTESRELFGDYLDYFEARSDDFSASKAPIVKKLIKSRASQVSMGESESCDSFESREIETFARASKTRSSPRPGQVTWPWASFPQPQQFSQSLASLWKNLELSYIENLKEIFHLKRINSGAFDPYKNFVTRHMNEFVERPDKKQDSLHEFHRAFNAIDPQIRDNSDVKKELYCRIDDFQTKLWEICDLRRREAQAEKNRLILEHWLTFELVNIANTYIDILQTEMDRCNDTLQFIHDYYTSMLQRPFQEVRSSVKLRKILAEAATSGSRPEIPSSRLGSSRNLREKESGDAKFNISLSKIAPAPFPPEVHLFEEETPKFFDDSDRESVFSAPRTLAYKTIESNIQFIQKILEFLASRVLENLKKEEYNEARSSSRKTSSLRKSEQQNEQKNIQDLILEWRYASMFEINRIRVRMKILDASARHDINFLLDGSRRLFSDIQKNIIERYDREIKSVDEMAKVFRFAIEEATPIQQEMLLDGDRFIVRSNVLMFPDKPEVAQPSFSHGVSEKFTIPMLSRLLEIFRHAAPSGMMLERSFVYILQDLLVCGDVVSGNRAFPLSWSKLRGCDVPRLVTELFGDEEFIDWREFIIYASDVEMPRADEIVRDFRLLRSIDDKSREFVSRQDFISTNFWFSHGISCPEEILDSGNDEQNENHETSKMALLKNLFFQMFSCDHDKVNYVAFLMAFCKDEQPKIGLGKALSLATGDEICIDWEEGEKYVREFFEDKRESDSLKPTKNHHEESAKISAAIFDALLDRVFRLAAPDFQNFSEKVSNFPPRTETTENSETSENSNSLESTWVSGEKTSTSVHSEEAERKNRSVTINVPEESESAKLSQSPESPESLAVHWLNIEVAQTVLAACLPSHAARENLLETGASLRENLELVYEQLRGGEEPSDDIDVMILAHRFIHHDFVEKLLADTTKFTWKRLGNVVNDIIMKK